MQVCYLTQKKIIVDFIVLRTVEQGFSLHQCEIIGVIVTEKRKHISER